MSALGPESTAVAAGAAVAAVAAVASAASAVASASTSVRTRARDVGSTGTGGIAWETGRHKEEPQQVPRAAPQKTTGANAKSK